MKKKSNYIVIEITIVIFVLSVLAWIFIPKFLASQNINTPQNFPDPVVRAAVEKFMEVEPGGYFNQRMANEKTGRLTLTPNPNVISKKDNQFVFHFKSNNKKILVPGISNLTGLYHFSSIKELHFVAGHDLTEFKSLFLSKLESLKITGGNVLNVSFSQYPNLTRLSIACGTLKTLDISMNTNLTYLSCSYNNLKMLDITNNRELNRIFCHSNQLKQLNTNRNENLVYLSCGNNYLLELNVLNNPKLSYLDINNNEISKLDVSQCPNITQIDIAKNPISEIDLSQQSNLKKIILDVQQLFYAKIIIHQSVLPEIEIREGIWDYSENRQKEIQAQINKILNQHKNSFDSN